MRHAAANSPTTSPLPSFQGQFRTQYSVVLVGQRQNPFVMLGCQDDVLRAERLGGQNPLLGIELIGVEYLAFGVDNMSDLT